MTTDTKRLLEAGLDLGQAAWDASKDEFDWANGMDRYVIHQISSVHTKLICERLCIDPAKVPLTYPRYGNVGPASIPITLANEAPNLEHRRPRPGHGHRIGAEHQLHRNRLVIHPAFPTAEQFRRWGVDPQWSRSLQVPGHDGVDALVARARSSADRRDAAGHHRVRARQPDVVVPVARPASTGWATGTAWWRSISWAWAGPTRTDRRRYADRVRDLGRCDRRARRSTARWSSPGTTGAVRSRWAGRSAWPASAVRNWRAWCCATPASPCPPGARRRGSSGWPARDRSPPWSATAHGRSSKGRSRLSRQAAHDVRRERRCARRIAAPRSDGRSPTSSTTCRSPPTIRRRRRSPRSPSGCTS